MMKADRPTISVAFTDGPLSDERPALFSGVGARVCFEGIVRPIEQERSLAALRYSMYEAMAKRAMHRLAAELMQEFGLLAVHVQHSRGRVPVGACSFQLVIDAEHRKQSLEAMDRFIDEMKRDVPIWKTAEFTC